MDRESGGEAEVEVGLCLTCRHARTVESASGAVFYLCELSREDPSFPRYPRLPVLSCSGYRPRESND